VTKFDRVGSMFKRIDAPPHSLRHERDHRRYQHRSSMGDTKLSDGLSENCLDGVIKLCLKSGCKYGVCHLSSDNKRQT